MKKYILALFLVGFLLTPAFSFAQTGDVDPNPDTDPCVALQSSDLRYRSRDVKTNEEVSAVQDFLQSKGYLNSEPTGFFGILTLKAVKDFQRANSINPTGYVGPLTKEKIKALTCDGTIVGGKDEYGCIPSAGYSWCQVKNKCLRVWEEKCEIVSSTNPTISVVSSPQTLKINETGKWTITASDSSGGNLSYSVKWGDENYKSSGTPVFSLEKDKQNTKFRHSYSKAGIYTPTFTVTNESGGSAQTSISVNVGSQTSTPSITILSPKAGESYHKGDRLPIDWTVSGIPPYVQGTTIDRRITVELYKEGVLNRGMFSTPFIEDANSLSWLIGDEVKEGNDYQVNFIVKYKDVNGNEKTLQKKSDNFKIVFPTPVITISAIPTSVVAGGASTIEWSTTDAKSCTGYGGWAGSKPISGREIVYPTQTTTIYGLICTGVGGVAYQDAKGAMVTVGTSSAPDLTASTVADTTITKGQNTTFYVDITNRGNASTGASTFNNTFWLNNEPNNTTTTGNLGVLAGPLSAGGKQRVSVSYAFPTVGTYYGHLCADEGTSLTAKTVTESDETNNCGNWTTIQVVEANPVTLPAPTGVTGSAVSQYSTLIKWNSVSGASGYNVYKDNTRNERVLLARTLQGTTVWYDTQAVCNTTYGYYVEAFKYDAALVPIGSGNISPKVSVQTPGCTTLASVQVLTPNGGEIYKPGDTVNISWKATSLTNQSNSVSVNVYAARADKDYNSGKSSPVFGITLGNSVNGGVVSDTGSYAWTIPTYFSVGQYIVLVKSSFTSNPDISDNPFLVTLNSRAEKESSLLKSNLTANVLNGFDNANNSAEQNLQTNSNTNVSSSCGEFTMTLSKGMVNAEVKCLQKLLNEKGFKIEGVKTGEETNYFGYNTLMALKKFQKSNQLTVDGIFGLASREMIKK